MFEKTRRERSQVGAIPKAQNVQSNKIILRTFFYQKRRKSFEIQKESILWAFLLFSWVQKSKTKTLSCLLGKKL